MAVTLGVLIASLLVPKKYEATARLALAEQASQQGADAESTQRLLATAETFVKSPAVLRRADEQLAGSGSTSSTSESHRR